MSTTVEPIWSASADGVWWRYYQRIRPEWNESVCDWMRTEGMDPNGTQAVEVHSDGETLHAVVTEYVYDDEGRLMVSQTDSNEARTRTYTRVLSSYPPEWPEEGE